MNRTDKKYYTFFSVVFLALIFITIKVVLFSSNHKQFKSDNLENVAFVNQYLFPAFPDSSRLANVHLSDEFKMELKSILENHKGCSLESVQQFWSVEDSALMISDYYLYFFAKQAISEFQDKIYDVKAQKIEKDNIIIYEAQLLVPKENIKFRFEIKTDNLKIEILNGKGIQQLISRNCADKKSN